MGDLVVELYGQRVGTLKGTWRTFDLVPEPEAVRRYGLDSPILSVAIPLTVVATRARKERRQAFFHELLPEGNMLTRMAHEVGLQEQDVIGMLRAYGRDIAGALQIWDPDVPGEPRQPAIEPLSSSDVAGLLVHVGDNPLGNKPVGASRLSPACRTRLCSSALPTGGLGRSTGTRRRTSSSPRRESTRRPSTTRSTGRASRETSGSLSTRRGSAPSTAYLRSSWNATTVPWTLPMGASTRRTSVRCSVPSVSRSTSATAVASASNEWQASSRRWATGRRPFACCGTSSSLWPWETSTCTPRTSRYSICPTVRWTSHPPTTSCLRRTNRTTARWVWPSTMSTGTGS
ncbi:HipA N-terminal domain-containing protein [Oerskovia sp. M15]